MLIIDYFLIAIRTLIAEPEITALEKDVHGSTERFDE